MTGDEKYQVQQEELQQALVDTKEEAAQARKGTERNVAVFAVEIVECQEAAAVFKSGLINKRQPVRWLRLRNNAVLTRKCTQSYCVENNK